VTEVSRQGSCSMHVPESLSSICSTTERSARALRRLRHRIIISSFVVFFSKRIGVKLVSFLKWRYVVYTPTTRLPRALLYIYIYIYIYMYMYIYCIANSGNRIFKFGADAARPRSGIIRDSALCIPIAHRPATTKR